MTKAFSNLRFNACLLSVEKFRFLVLWRNHSVTVNASKFKSAEKVIDDLNPYYIENCLRKVYPYYYDFTTFCKRRWLNQKIVDVYCKEFALYPKEEIIHRFNTGRISVNGNTVTGDYRLKDHDLIRSKVHRHELPVLATTIEILHEDEDVLVINKPSSIPVHPTGMYNYNTVVNILIHSGLCKTLHMLHRIDRLTSGVLIFAKSSQKAGELHEEMRMKEIQKEYVCRVEGEFPDNIVLCDKPLRKIHDKIGVSLVDSQGKSSITEFTKLSFNGKSSVVLCKPFTGRTHQIRAHLQFLGYPILNDPLYNSLVFGPDKGKYGQFNKSVSQLLEDLVKEHSINWMLEDSPVKHAELDFQFLKSNLDAELMSEKYQKDSSRFTNDKLCYFCRNSFKDPQQTHLGIFLHAIRYKGKKWDFSTDMPHWALDCWNFM